MAAAANSRNVFAIVISIIVVVAVVAVGVLVYFMNRTAAAPAEAPAAGVVNEETGAIVVGEADHVLETYVDFMCPFCGDFEESWGEEISGAVEDGSLELHIFPVGLLDHLSQGTDYSTRAANALYCAVEEDPDSAYPYQDRLFENQPSEGSTGLDDDELISIAAEVGVESDTFEACVTDRAHADFVKQVSDEMPENPQSGSKGAPTVILDGDEWLNWQLPADEELLPRLS